MKKLVLALAATSIMAFGPAHAAYPDKPIKVIVPTGHGGSVDNMARIFQEVIERNKLLPQPLAIVNVPAAGGTAGTRQVKDAAADGYTIGLWHSGLVTSAAMGVTEYDHKAFDIIAQTGGIPLGLAVKESSRFKSAKDLIDETRSKPNTVRMGTNIGLTVHFVPLTFQKEAGIQFRFVQAGGGAKRLQSILGGHTDVALFSTQEFLNYASSGLKPVVLFADKRHPKLPNLPTAKDLGYKLEWTEVFVWLAPKGTPKNVLDMLAGALRKAMDDSVVKDKFEAQAMELTYRDGAQVGTMFDGLVLRAREVAAEAKATPNE